MEVCPENHLIFRFMSNDTFRCHLKRHFSIEFGNQIILEMYKNTA